MHVLGARDQPRRRLERPVGRERNPISFEIVGDRGCCRRHLGISTCVHARDLVPGIHVLDSKQDGGDRSKRIPPRLAVPNCDCYHAANPAMLPDGHRPTSRNKLKARLPRGLADRGPAEIAATRRMIETIRTVYERYGFEPVETPAFEYTDALGKFLPDQDRPNEGVFSFQDDDEQWLSLRYDLTAPLARYVAENFDTLPKPYRSYRAGYVFRNEKPGPGRFRQFMQFDADTVGSRLARRRCRDVHDGGGHDGGARHSARQLRGEGEQPQGARRRAGSDRARRRSQCRQAADRAAGDRQDAIGSARRRAQLLGDGPKGRKRRFHKRRRSRR